LIQPPQITSFTATPTLGTAPVVGVPVAFAVTVADPTKVHSVEWDFDGNGTVDQTTSTFTTQFTYTTAGTFNPMVTVVDTDGGDASATTTVTVQSPVDAISTAITLVQALPLNAGNQNSLIAKLNAASTNISHGDLPAACQSLQDLLTEMNDIVQSGRLTPASAAPLVGEVQAIRLGLGCP
jgi:PKD repeat protein